MARNMRTGKGQDQFRPEIVPTAQSTKQSPRNTSESTFSLPGRSLSEPRGNYVEQCSKPYCVSLASQQQLTRRESGRASYGLIISPENTDLMITDLFHNMGWPDRRWEVLSYAHLRELTDLANVTLLTFVAPDVHHKVHEHWHQFPVPHPLWHPVLGTLYVIIGLLALTGNSMVLWVFTMTRSLRSGTNLLTMNLALSDLLMMLTQFPVLISNCFHQSWTLGPLAYTV
ncbi:uncharacterized protein LOC122244934 [Penaeus japonicus]|uniref:uncharacterized protein LOC122244934 n=1 Tax=Penaeus japonicus TaxID=27405 RepID=UPI001C716954|nr:uncharacterized protein LOC122244934 [Penaeus japonicus]